MARGTLLLCVLPTKAVQEERRTGLAAWLNVVMKAGSALMPLAEGGKPFSKPVGKNELRFGQIVCKNGKAKSCCSCSMR